METTPVAVVTGAASGIGASTVSRLTDDFVKVVALDLDADRLHRTWVAHSRVEAASADVRDEQSVHDSLANRHANPSHFCGGELCRNLPQR